MCLVKCVKINELGGERGAVWVLKQPKNIFQLVLLVGLFASGSYSPAV